MATLYIEEYADLAESAGGGGVQAPGRLVAKQKVAVGAASAQSSALDARTRWVVLTADVPCQWETGSTNPTADGGSRYLAADVPRAFRVDALDEIAVIEQQ